MRILILVSLLLTSCAVAELGPQGKRVVIVDSLSASDLLYYEPLDEISSRAMMSVGDCYRDLRNQAGALGADIVRVSSKEPAYCALDSFDSKKSKDCFTVHGQAFRKIKSTAAAGK
jgi:hypothetical protein